MLLVVQCINLMLCDYLFSVRPAMVACRVRFIEVEANEMRPLVRGQTYPFQYLEKNWKGIFLSYGVYSH